jgi:hypothetical protein
MKINTIEHKNGENTLKLKKRAMLGTRIGRDHSKTWEIEVFEENMHIPLKHAEIIAVSNKDTTEVIQSIWV